MTAPLPALVRSTEYPGLRALLDVSTFGYPRYTLAALPERLYSGLDEAQRPADVVQVPAIETTGVPTPMEVLSNASESLVEGWPTETRRSLARLETLWLLVEDRYRRLDASTVEPLAHQAALVEHLLTTPGLERVLVGDEVGLGKTIEAGLLIQRLQDRTPGFRTLYLTEARLVDNVVEEFERLGLRPRRWTADRPEARLTAGDSDRLVVASIHRAVVNQDVVGGSGPWDLLVVDEAHHLTDWSPDGNDPQERMRLVRRLISERMVPSGRVILLSGTPHQGNRDRFVNLLRLLGQGNNPNEATGRVIYRIKDDIRGWDGEPLFPVRQVNPHRVIDVPEGYHRWLAMVHALLAPGAGASRASGWRRATALQWCASSPQAGLAYLVRLALRSGVSAGASAVVGEAIAALRPYRGGPANEPIPVLEARLVRVSSEGNEEAEELFTGGRGRLEKVLELGIGLVREDAFGRKLRELFSLLSESPDEKFVVFAQPIETVYTLRDRLEQQLGRGLVALIVGGQDQATRKAEIDKFVENRAVRVLVSSRSGGEGINLQVARRLVHFDIPWNPMEMEQRVGRVHRYGGAQTVVVDTFVLAGSREERVLARARARLARIVTDLDRERVELLFSRTMSLVPLDELSLLMAGENLGPLSPAEEDRLDHIVTDGYHRLQETEAEFRRRTVALRSPEPGAVGYADLESWLLRHAGGRPVEGWTRWVLAQAEGEAVPHRIEQPAAVIEMDDGRIVFTAPETAIGISGPNGRTQRPLRIGLNDSRVAARARNAVEPSSDVSGAGLALVHQSDWETFRTAFNIPATLRKGAIFGAYLSRTIDPNPSAREVERRLHAWLVVADGSSSHQLTAAATAELIRMIREPRPKLKRPVDLGVAGLRQFDRERVDGLRHEMGRGLLNAVFPLAAIWVEPTSEQLPQGS